MQAFRMEPTNPVLAAIIVFVVRTVFMLTEVLPDPKVAFIQSLDGLPEGEARKRKEEIRTLDNGYELFVKTQLSGPGYPFSAKAQ